MLHSHHTLLHSDDIWGTLQLLLHTLSVLSQVVHLTKSSLTAEWIGPNRNHIFQKQENTSFKKDLVAVQKGGK